MAGILESLHDPLPNSGRTGGEMVAKGVVAWVSFISVDWKSGEIVGDDTQYSCYWTMSCNGFTGALGYEHVRDQVGIIQ